MQPSSGGPNWHHGRAGAPKGTKEWADNLRLSLLNQQDHLGEGESDFLLYVDALKREEGWKLLTRPDGTTFESFDAFCAFRKPYGLGTTWEKLRPFVDAGLAKQGKLSPPAPSATTISLASIRLDGGTQSRAGIDDAVVADYAEHVDALPPAVVFYDGAAYWLADGFHRVAAHQLAGREHVAADVRQGSRRDAVLFSVGANAQHGLRRTTADKQRAIEMLLKDEEWGQRSNEWIADRCGVNDMTVSARRKALEATSEIRKLGARVGKDGKTRKLPKKPTPPDRETPAKSTIHVQSRVDKVIANEREKAERFSSPVAPEPPNLSTPSNSSPAVDASEAATGPKSKGPERLDVPTPRQVEPRTLPVEIEGEDGLDDGSVDDPRQIPMFDDDDDDDDDDESEPAVDPEDVEGAIQDALLTVAYLSPEARARFFLLAESLRPGPDVQPMQPPLKTEPDNDPF